jgi:drug/metabolite transporter (DMT)-like permease
MADTMPAAGVLRAEHAGLVGLLLGAVGIAFAPIFVRLSELAPTATAFHRFALALPFLWIWLAVSAGSHISPANASTRPTRPADLLRLAAAGLFFAGDMAFWHWSIAYTSVANATLLANSAPVFVVLAGWLLFGRSFGAQFLLGMALALAGTVVLMHASGATGARSLLGDLFGVITGAFYGAYLMTVERLRATFSTATVMAYSITVSALAVLVVALAGGEPLLPETARGWTVLVGLALVSQVLGQSLIAFGLAHLPVAFASVSLLVQPVLAGALAWVLLEEAMGPQQGIGAAIALAGIEVARRGGGMTRP